MEVASCTKCGLAATRTQTVFARGNPKSSLCFVGEAPGADEDAQGLPFVGRAGQLLDRTDELLAFILAGFATVFLVRHGVGG